MRNFLIICLIIFSSCTGDKVVDRNIEIIIESSKSYKFNLRQEIFTIFYLSKSPAQIKFHLTNEEKNRIINRYYQLKINEIIGKTKILDECIDMPKLYTILKVNTRNSFQEIEIDSECNNFNFSNYKQANRVREFLKFVGNILHSKPEIKNAPISDILYL